MPNWCFNQIYITGGSEKQRRDLYKEIESKIKSTCFPEADKNWIGNLSVACGIPKEEVEKDDSKYRCRAFISTCQLVEEDLIYLEIESAWNPIDDYLSNLFDADLESLKGMEYYFYAEECGEDIFVTNDVNKRFFKDRFIYDDFEGKMDTTYFETEDEFLRFVNSSKFKRCHDIDEDFHSFDEVQIYCYENDCCFTVRKIDVI